MAARNKKKKAKAASRKAKPTARKAKARKAKPTAKKAKATPRKAKPAARKAKPAAKKAKPTAKKAKAAPGELSLVASSFSRDGRWLATSSEGKVHVWDLAPVRQGGHAALVLRVTESIFPDRIALSPDGTRLAVASHGHPEVRVYDTAHGALAWTAALHAVTAIAFAPDGGRIVVGDVLVEEKARRGFAAVLDASTGVPLWRSPAVDRPLRDVAFHADGLLVIAVLGPDGVAVVWDAERGNELFRFPARLTPQEVNARSGCASAITADGQRVAFAFDGRAEVWRVDSAERTASIVVGGRAKSVALARDGSLLVTGSPVPARWTLPHGAKAGVVGGDGRVCLSPDGDLLLAASSYTELAGPPLEPARR